MERFASFSSGTTFEIAFDNFNNPSLQELFLVPINMRISLMDRTNNDVWTSNFPAVYVSDSHNIGIPTQIGGSFTRSNSNRGASAYHYNVMYWPYTSNYNDITEKVVMKISGGITCCTAYDTFVLDSNVTGAFVELWTDKVANITVYRTPSINHNTYLQLQILNVKNPWAYQRDTYEQIKEIEVLFYDNYKNTYIKQITQFAFSSYNRGSEISVDTNLGSPIHPPKSYSYHSHYPMVYDIEYSFSTSSFANRELDETILKFTSGVREIEWANIRYSTSPEIVNNVLEITIFKDNSNYWCLRIKGMDDGLYSSSQRWIIRMRFYPNGNTLSYVSYTYNFNGELEATNSDSESLSGDGYSSAPVAPTTFDLFQERYMRNYFELQRKRLYADTGLTTDKMYFRFTAPYDMVFDESIDIKIPTVAEMIGSNTPNDLTCIFQPEHSARATLGYGLYAKCNYSLGVYSVSTPHGGLAKGDYTLVIMERNQTTSSFDMPAQPNRYEIPFIYNNKNGFQFGDTYILSFSSIMKSFSVSHLTYRYSTYNMLGFSFTPRFTLPAASLTSPITESVLEISLESRYFSSCLGVENIFSSDGVDFESGAYFSHYSEPAVSNANTRVLCGQYSESYAPVKLTVTDYGQMSANSNYYFRFPLITNPSGTNTPLLYKVRLLSYANSQYYPVVMGEYEYHNIQQTVSGSSSWQYIYTSESNDDVQKTMSLSITYNYYYPPNGAQVLVKFKNN